MEELLLQAEQPIGQTGDSDARAPLLPEVIWEGPVELLQARSKAHRNPDAARKEQLLELGDQLVDGAQRPAQALLGLVLLMATALITRNV